MSSRTDAAELAQTPRAPQGASRVWGCAWPGEPWEEKGAPPDPTSVDGQPRMVRFPHSAACRVAEGLWHPGEDRGARHWFSALLPSAPGPPLLRPNLRGSSVRRFLSCDLPLAPSSMLSGSAMGPDARPGLPEPRKPSLAHTEGLQC